MMYKAGPILPVSGTAQDESFFPVRITSALVANQYTFVEVWTTPGGVIADKVGGRFNSYADPAYAIDGSTFSVTAAGSAVQVLARRSAGSGGVGWELIPSKQSPIASFEEQDNQTITLVSLEPGASHIIVTKTISSTQAGKWQFQFESSNYLTVVTNATIFAFASGIAVNNVAIGLGATMYNYFAPTSGLANFCGTPLGIATVVAGDVITGILQIDGGTRTGSVIAYGRLSGIKLS